MPRWRVTRHLNERQDLHAPDPEQATETAIARPSKWDTLREEYDVTPLPDTPPDGWEIVGHPVDPRAYQRELTYATLRIEKRPQGWYYDLDDGQEGHIYTRGPYPEAFDAAVDAQTAYRALLLEEAARLQPDGIDLQEGS